MIGDLLAKETSKIRLNILHSLMVADISCVETNRVKDQSPFLM